MKAAGIFIAIPSIMAATILVWLIYVVTFGEPNHTFMFETEPPEGYDYWRRKEFWADLWPFLGYSSLAIGAGLMPILALFFASPKRPQKFATTIAVLGIVFALAPGMLTMSLIAAKNFHFVFWASPVLVVACIYAVMRAAVTLSKIQGE